MSKLPLIDQIKSDSIAARKAAIGKPEGSVENVTAKTLTLLMSNLQSVMKESQSETLTDNEAVGVVKKGVKTVEDAVSKGAAGDYAAKLAIERDVLLQYLPQQLGEAEITNWINDFAQQQGRALEVRDTGVIMKTLNTNYPGQVDGKLVSDVIKRVVNG